MVFRLNPKGFLGLTAGMIFAAFVVFPCLIPLTSSAENCGDINGDQVINMNDITFFISYLYKNGPCPENLALCDVNHSQSINILDPVFLLSSLYKEGPSPNCPSSGPGGSVISDSGCKSYYKAAEATATEDCLQWEYVNGYTLRIRHQNGCFNCCAEPDASFYISGDTIIIIEAELFGEWGPCACLCLFDVQFEISAIPPGVYFIRITELNVGDSLLNVTIDLREQPSGSHCIYRDTYPWNLYGTQPVGELLSREGCLTSETSDSVYTEDCVVYNYTADSVLTIEHLNDLFNCCPDSLYAIFDFYENIIDIVELQSLGGSGGCDCLCLYNMNYRIAALPPGLWTIRIDNRKYYSLYGNGEMIEFQVDLTPGVTGSACVDRIYLPWEGVQ
ncbi:MAG: dockerin type I repeat-containing protein [Candidatus Zixiibacteriota bacterium]